MTGLAARIGLGAISGPVGAFFGSISPRAWLAIGGALALILGVLYHQHRIHTHDATLIKAEDAKRDAAWQAVFDKEHQAALLWKQGFDQRSATISTQERKLHDQAVASNAAIADALRLRGPGAASAANCRPGDHPGVASPSGGHEQAASQTGASSAQVPTDDRAIVSWTWIVQIVQEHDDVLDEAARWRDADAKHRAEWPKQPKP